MTETQQMMDMQLPRGEHVTAGDIAAVNGFTAETMSNAIKTDKIGAFKLNGRAKQGQEVRTTARIPRHCAILYLCKTFTSDAEKLTSDVLTVLDRLPLGCIAKIHSYCARRLNHR